MLTKGFVPEEKKTDSISNHLAEEANENLDRAQPGGTSLMTEVAFDVVVVDFARRWKGRRQRRAENNKMIQQTQERVAEKKKTKKKREILQWILFQIMQL